VFPIAEDAILCDPIQIPKHWHQIVGMDFGWDHPFAATRNAWDKDNDTWYVVASYREAKATPPIHVAEKWSRFPGQFGGLAKVDLGFGYAANFSSSACIA
jgi:hypothetical protein